MAFPQRFLDELVDRSDIVDVVSSYVSLSKKGGNYFGLCPLAAAGLLKTGVVLGHLHIGPLCQKAHRVGEVQMNRLMFPVIDVKGDVVAFGGRVLDKSEPKYMNTTETIVYSMLISPP